MNFFAKRKIRKQLKAVLHHAQTLRSSREDVMNAGELAFLDEHVRQAQAAYKDGNAEAMEKTGSELEACVSRLNPPRPMAGWRENFDVLVVAISVAMAFRAYFYQPFKIPTGSMQPTLYGIHSEPRDPSDATLLDRQPFKFAKWLVTGESFKNVRAKASGTVHFMPGDGSRKPGYMPVVVAGVPHYVPNDAVEADEYRRPVRLKGGVSNGASVKAGDVLWSGVVISGDFVFVNRWKWNFAHPTRGEVMVFSTTGITALQQGTHYIKRMTGLPNETLQVKAPNLLVNGTAVTEPLRVGQIARKEKVWPKGPAYSGFNPSGTRQVFLQGKSLADENDSVTLTGSQYYAMGDNSFNSFDSRYWGPVPERNLLGPATVVYWPFTSPRFGRIR
ncbi:MAG TPA: signal peptidase I [Kiritimatiellia bacterium]|nr:signal peptidase I [Kiritimatiellia bacterium]HPS06226.1 signal peptidase I [Kiritimatiellia bacterium]